MALSKEMVEQDDFATKREAYYVSKNWGEAKFQEQPESGHGAWTTSRRFFAVNREQLRFYPEEHGGAVGRPAHRHRPRPRHRQRVRIDCTNFGSGSYSIPHSVEHLKFETKAKFILAIETGGMFQRLNNHKFWKTENCILVETAGVPTRATRRFVRRLADDKAPRLRFVDCDPYGISNIYRTLKVGSGNAVHLNQFFCVPQARYLGVTPQDIIDFKLQDATHKLQEVDIKRAKDALKNDPFFQATRSGQQAIEQIMSHGRARRAAGPRQVGPQLRDRRVPAQEARACGRGSCRKASGAGAPLRAR
ncbi:MAG: DNA topoisomerase VI [bacterium]|nr:DNA topoisomerase VI [bacterium]